MVSLRYNWNGHVSGGILLFIFYLVITIIMIFKTNMSHWNSYFNLISLRKFIVFLILVFTSFSASLCRMKLRIIIVDPGTSHILTKQFNNIRLVPRSELLHGLTLVMLNIWSWLYFICFCYNYLLFSFQLHLFLSNFLL